MSSLTVRPNANDPTFDSTVTGAATAHEALRDDSDGSYVYLQIETLVTVDLADVTFPAAAVVKSVGVRLRLSGPNALVRTMLSIADPVTTTVSWSTPTTITVLISEVSYSDAELDGAQLTVQAVSAPITVYEAYVDVVYVTQPSVAVTTDGDPDSNLPYVNLAATVDPDGGAVTWHEIKVFAQADYSAVGFDPATSTPTATTGVAAGSGERWQVPSPLPDGTWRAYARVAQTVNGVTHWGAWAYDEFTVVANPPGEPAVAIVDEGASGRIAIVITPAATGEAADYFQIERFDPASGVFHPVRTTLGGGRVQAVAGGSTTAYDYEAPAGDSVLYTVFALADVGGVMASSDGVGASGSWTTRSQWLKYPGDIDMAISDLRTYGEGTYGAGFYGDDEVPHLAVRVHAYAGHQRPARQAVLQPLGRPDPIVVSDTRGPAAGTVVFLVDSDAQREKLEALVDTSRPLLLQMAGGDRRPDRWVRFGDHTRAAVSDKAYIAETFETLTWTEVSRPD